MPDPLTIVKDLEKARKTLIEMRHNWAKTIAAGYKRGDTENAVKAITEYSRQSRRLTARSRRRETKRTWTTTTNERLAGAGRPRLKAPAVRLWRGGSQPTGR
jgi:ribosomal protein L4